jgi:hypothetical protein
MLSLEWRGRIEAWLLAYLAQPGLQHELRDVAAFGALPLYSDVGGCIALRPDGRVVQVIWEKPEQSFFDAPAPFRTAALVRGSQVFPELRELLPARPEGAADCANCEGRGEIFKGVICGACFGLGFAAPL